MRRGSHGCAGIGRFTIADEAVVSEPDLGVNFFLDHESVGTSRARRCAELLQELNPDVQGNWFPRGEVCKEKAISFLSQSGRC